MSRPEGLPKTGGRKKGTPNRRSLELADQLAAVGLDVPTEVAKALAGLDGESKSRVLLELMAFLFPKRKAIEHSGQLTALHQPEVKEVTPEEEEARNARFKKTLVTMIEIDKDLSRLVTKTIVSMYPRHILPGDCVDLLRETFKPKTAD